MHNRLLIVDDEPEIGAFISRIASTLSYEIFSVTTADKFLEHVRSWRPSHIIMDLRLPDTDGMALLSRLAGERSRATIFLISGLDRSVVEAARRVGIERGLNVAGVLTKPFRVPELRAILEAARNEEPWISPAVLATAFEEHQFRLAYQPKIRLDDGLFCGVEALLRWTHPQHGDVPPGLFIPHIEAGSMIDRLTNWVAETACRQVATWSKQSLSVNLALNISAFNLHDGRFADSMSAICRSFGVVPDDITLELTETAAMHDAVQMADVMTRLRVKGFRLAIDDFGTGYSSLVQLHRLPFSELKIDRAFIKDCVRSSESASIVKMIVELGRMLRMNTVAEGVEDEATLGMLRDLGCDAAQGYLIAKPMEAAFLPTWIERHGSGSVEAIGARHA